MSFINQQNAPFAPGTETIGLSGNLFCSGSIDSSGFQTSENVELSGIINLSGSIFSHAATVNTLFGSINLSGSINSTGIQNSENVSLSGLISLSGTIQSFPKVPLNSPAPILKELSANAFSAGSYSARALKDGEEIPIKGFTISAGKGTIGKTVSLDLATKDLSVADKDASYKFDLGKAANPYDIPEWTPILNNARLDSRNYRMAWLGDSLSFGMSAPLEEKLGKFPKKNIFVSDPDKIQNSIEEIEVLKDSNGNVFEQEERFIPALSFYDIFQIAFVEGCGFSSVHTNIPDNEISRCDFTITNSFYETIKPFIGIFEPEFYAVGNVLWIEDKTQPIPGDFAPAAISPDRFLSWNNTVPAEKRLDGFKLQFVESKKNSNYYIPRTDTETVRIGEDPFEIGYSEIVIERKYREYRSSFKPELVLRTEQVSEKRIVKVRDASGLNIIREDFTEYTYDSRSRLTKQTKTESAPVWSYFEGLGWTKSVTPQTLRTSVGKTRYGAHPENPRRTVKTGSDFQIKSILVEDTANPFLGETDKQQYIDSVHNRNLNENQTVSFFLEPVKTIVEKLKPSAGQVRMERIEIDHLIGEVTDSSSDVQNGDGSVSNFESKQGEFVVFKPGLTPTNRPGYGIEVLPIGELDPQYGEPLAERLLDRRTRKISEGSIDVLGWDEELERGVYFRLLDRFGDSLGIFVVEGFTITGTNLGSQNQRIATTLEVREV